LLSFNSAARRVHTSLGYIRCSACGKPGWRSSSVARSVPAVAGPRILYSTFAVCTVPVGGSRYERGAAYDSRRLGLKSHSCRVH
jgi:hypothetical protein